MQPATLIRFIDQNPDVRSVTLAADAWDNLWLYIAQSSRYVRRDSINLHGPIVCLNVPIYREGAGVLPAPGTEFTAGAIIEGPK